MLAVAEEVARVPLFEGQAVPVTISVGVASTAGGEEVSAEELLGRADHQLYEAKRGGRNRVVANAA